MIIRGKCYLPTVDKEKHIQIICVRSSSDCTRYLVAYQGGVVNIDLGKDGLPPGIVFCSKTCWNAYVKSENAIVKSKTDDATGRKRKSWDKDGSIHVLFDWMTTEGNYSKY